jgi:hypothetical protein
MPTRSIAEGRRARRYSPDCAQTGLARSADIIPSKQSADLALLAIVLARPAKWMGIIRQAGLQFRS